jgi:hypothetical protein
MPWSMTWRRRKVSNFSGAFTLSFSNELDFSFDLDGNIERKLRHAYGTSGVRTPVMAKNLDHQLGEAIDDGWLLVEAWG